MAYIKLVKVLCVTRSEQFYKRKYFHWLKMDYNHRSGIGTQKNNNKKEDPQRQKTKIYNKDSHSSGGGRESSKVCSSAIGTRYPQEGGQKDLVQSPPRGVEPEAEPASVGSCIPMILAPSERGPSRTRETSYNLQWLSSAGPPEEHPWTESIPAARSPSLGLESWCSKVDSWNRRAARRTRLALPVSQQAISASGPTPPEPPLTPPPPTLDTYSLRRARLEGARLKIGPPMPEPQPQPPHPDLHPPSTSTLLCDGGPLCYPVK
ncbi:hypothetical protein BHM03_00011851 [Ensete ventricosum]|nr:hypothetical protein BHM03_00011851 [Ensete ventricosum]